jgi:hypothetical protein
MIPGHIVRHINPACSVLLHLNVWRNAGGGDIKTADIDIPPVFHRRRSKAAWERSGFQPRGASFLAGTASRSLAGLQIYQ